MSLSNGASAWVVDTRHSNAITTTMTAEPRAAQWVETSDGQAATFAVNNPASQLPAIDPGLWGGVYTGPPDAMPPASACSAWQWAGSNKRDVIGLWGTPVGETDLQFQIENVPGFIELTGDCYWSGGANP